MKELTLLCCCPPLLPVPTLSPPIGREGLPPLEEPEVLAAWTWASVVPAAPEPAGERSPDTPWGGGVAGSLSPHRIWMLL